MENRRNLTPEEVLSIFRSQATPEAMRRIAALVVLDAESEDPRERQQARAFLKEVLLPKDLSKVEDTRFKRVVFCSFEEYNEIQKLQKRVAELERENEKLRGVA